MNITNIIARSILDSRGNPTVEAEVWCEGGGWGRAASPSGASTGAHEAHELRDGDDAWCGKGVEKAISNIENKIKPALLGVSADDQYRLDELMIDLDGTKNKSNLGANAILAVSLATSHAAASARSIPLFQHINDIAHNPSMSLPLPMCNVLNGGQHASNSADFQEYMLIPIGAGSYREGIQVVSEIFHALKKVLAKRSFHTTVGDEGGFAPSVSSNTEMLDLLTEACQAAGFKPGKDITFALDVAASEFFKDDKYQLASENRVLDSEHMVEYLKEIAEKYPIISIEDGITEDGWEAWSELTTDCSDLQLVGDDLLVTNQERLERAIKERAGNSILIKPNQIGTLTETIRTIKTAKEAGWNTVVSHRSGETEDTTIAHLAVGTGAGQIKTGSVSRGERTAKHNELLRIEEQNPHLTLANPF